MRTVSQARLKSLEKQGATVKRQMGKSKVSAAKPSKGTAEKPSDAPVPHASMGASMENYEAHQEATRQLLAQNAETIVKFGESLKEAVQKDPADYDFKVNRDDEGLIDTVNARWVRPDAV